jgi:hypothetical protein
MSKIIKIQIIHALAMQSAKNETYQKGVVDKAVDQKLITAAYHEQAGNEAYHEAMLGRYLFSQIEKLKTYFADYLTGEGALANDATIDSTESDGITEILLEVSDRFNSGYTKTLARLSQKYVEDRMIHLWWAPVSKDFAALYAGLAEDDLEGIRHCFHKTEPAAPHYNFPTAINLRYPVIPERNGVPGFIATVPAASPAGSVIPVETLFSNPYLLGRGETSEISYTLTGEDDKKPFDDIIIRCDNPACCCAAIGPNGRWNIRGVNTGVTIVTLFSRHNDQVYAKFAVRVTNS